MRYYAPRQRRDTGKWHYTLMVGGKITPVGFCAEDCPGHDTPQGAADHFKEFLLEKTMRKMNVPELRMCMVCDSPTGRRVHIGKGKPIKLILCQEHQSRTDIESLVNFDKIAESYEMYQGENQQVSGLIVRG